VIDRRLAQEVVDHVSGFTVTTDSLYSQGLYHHRWGRITEEDRAIHEVPGALFEEWMSRGGRGVHMLRGKYLLYALEEYVSARLDAVALYRNPERVRVVVRATTPAAVGARTLIEYVTIEQRELKTTESRTGGGGQWLAKVHRPGRAKPFRIFGWP